jgi:uncharacterized membrane protein YhaH (DUF805 family)
MQLYQVMIVLAETAVFVMRLIHSAQSSQISCLSFLLSPLLVENQRMIVSLIAMSSTYHGCLLQRQNGESQNASLRILCYNA